MNCIVIYLMHLVTVDVAARMHQSSARTFIRARENALLGCLLVTATRCDVLYNVPGISSALTPFREPNNPCIRLTHAVVNYGSFRLAFVGQRHKGNLGIDVQPNAQKPPE